MGVEKNAAGNYPQVAKSAFVHQAATLIGNVYVQDNALIGPQAVIRADEPGSDGIVKPVIIGEGANIQDGVIVHALAGTEVNIGAGTSVAHGTVIHGPCEIGKRCFIGFNSVVFQAELEDDVVIMHLALVQSVQIPEGKYVPSKGVADSDGDVLDLERVPPEVASFVGGVRRINLNLAKTWPRG